MEKVETIDDEIQFNKWCYLKSSSKFGRNDITRNNAIFFHISSGNRYYANTRKMTILHTIWISNSNILGKCTGMEHVSRALTRNTDSAMEFLLHLDVRVPEMGTVDVKTVAVCIQRYTWNSKIN